MQGCAAVSLGTMPYKLYASPDFITHYFADGITRQSLFNAPAVIFNDKDRIHDRFIQQRFVASISPVMAITWYPLLNHL